MTRAGTDQPTATTLRTRRHKAKLKNAGLVQVNIWAPSEHVAKLRAFARQLAEDDAAVALLTRIAQATKIRVR